MNSIRSLAVLSLLSLLLVGCDGDAPDDAGAAPDSGASTDAGTSVDAGDAMDAEVDDDAAADDAGQDAGDAGLLDDAGGDDGGPADAATDGGSDASTDAGPPLSCQDGPVDLGSWSGQVPLGLASTTPAAVDAGLAAVLAAVPVTDGATAAVDLTVTAAVVTAFGFSASTSEDFWLADSTTVIRTQGTPIAGVMVGDTLNFQVTEVRRSFGVPTITALTGATRVAAAANVLVDEAHALPVPATSVNRLVHLYGELTSSEGTCGGTSRCWTLTSGSETHELRAPSVADMGVGSCVEVVAPVNLASGAPQLNMAHLLWMRTFCHSDADCVTVGSPICSLATGRCTD